MLKNALVLYVVHEAPPEPLTAHPAPSFAFGAPDASGIVGESRAAWRLARRARDGGERPSSCPRARRERRGQGARGTLDPRAVRRARRAASSRVTPRRFPEGLVDAELFGNAKNYPHAGSPERGGVVGEAEGGTLFLDEIGELPHALQGHLLRLLDRDGEYQRLGEARSRRADVRLVAATNRPLDALKHDLAARFSARVSIPSLRARRADVPLLVRHILRRFATETPSLVSRLFDERDDGPPEARVEPELIDALLRHDFTHHLRELERLLLLAVTTTRKPFVALTPEVVAELRLPSSESDGEPAADAVRAAIEACQGNISQAARRLGLKNRYLLYRLMKKHGIAATSEDDDDASERSSGSARLELVDARAFDLLEGEPAAEREGANELADVRGAGGGAGAPHQLQNARVRTWRPRRASTGLHRARPGLRRRLPPRSRAARARSAPRARPRRT